MDTLYLVFYKLQESNQGLPNSRGEINAMIQAFAFQLGFKILKIVNVGTQKIDDITLKTEEIIVSIFSILNKDSRERFFEKSFLLANVKPNIIFRVPFLIINNADIDFQAQTYNKYFKLLKIYF